MPTAELPRSPVWASEPQGPELPLQEAGRLLANARKEVQWRGRDQDLGQAVKTRVEFVQESGRGQTMWVSCS